MYTNSFILSQMNESLIAYTPTHRVKSATTLTVEKERAQRSRSDSVLPLTYHIYNQCVEQSPILGFEPSTMLFAECLQLATEKCDFLLNEFVIMNNHYHLLVQTVEGGTPIPKIMWLIKQTFSKYLNKIQGQKGTHWSRRYGCKIVEQQKNPQLYIMTLLGYLGYNPIKAGMVMDFESYRFSSIPRYLNADFSPIIPVTMHPAYKDLGHDFESRKQSVRTIFKFYHDDIIKVH